MPPLQDYIDTDGTRIIEINHERLKDKKAKDKDGYLKNIAQCIVEIVKKLPQDSYVCIAEDEQYEEAIYDAEKRFPMCENGKKYIQKLQNMWIVSPYAKSRNILLIESPSQNKTAISLRQAVKMGHSGDLVVVQLIS